MIFPLGMNAVLAGMMVILTGGALQSLSEKLSSDFIAL